MGTLKLLSSLVSLGLFLCLASRRSLLLRRKPKRRVHSKAVLGTSRATASPEHQCSRQQFHRNPRRNETDGSGNFTIGCFSRGILASCMPPNYGEKSKVQRLVAVDSTTVLPEPFVLPKVGGGITTPPTTTTTTTTTTTGDPTTQPTRQQPRRQPRLGGREDVSIDINTRNPRRGGVFTDVEAHRCPLGATR